MIDEAVNSPLRTDTRWYNLDDDGGDDDDDGGGGGDDVVRIY